MTALANALATMGSPGESPDSRFDAAVAAATLINASVGGLSTASLDLTAAQIKALNATPQTIIEAQGAGTVVVPVSGFVQMTYGTSAYATATNVGFAYEDSLVGTGILVCAIDGLLAATADGIMTITTNTVNASLGVNKAIKLFAADTDPTVGDSTLKIRMLYQVVTL